MTTPDEEIERRLNEFAAAVALGRSDLALTVAHSALTFCREHGVAHGEFAFNLVLCGLWDVSLFPLEYSHHVSRLVELAEAEADAITSVPVYRHAALAIDALIVPLPGSVRDQLAQRFAAVREAFDQPYDYSDAAELEVLLGVNLPAAERELLVGLEQTADAARAASDVEGALLDVAVVHSALCDAVRAVEATSGVRHHALGVVHDVAARAAYRLGQEVALYKACEGLLVESRLPTAYADPIKAAHTILWLVLQADPSSETSKNVYNTTTFRRIRKLVWRTVETLSNQRVARLAAANLNLVHPLVCAYVDFLARRPNTYRQASRLIGQYQGVLAGAAYLLAGDAEYRAAGDDFLAHELDCLMRYDQGQGPDGPESRQNLPLLARREPTIAPAAIAEDRSYRHVSFELTEVEESDVGAIDSRVLSGEIPASDVVVSLFLTEDWVYLERSGAQMTSLFVRAMSRGEFDQLAGALMESLRHPETPFGLEASAFAWLHDRLVGSSLVGLPAHVANVIFVAPQMTLPLHLAFNQRTGRYVIDDFAVTYAHSPTLYRHGLTRRPGPLGPALLIDGSRALNRRPLAHAYDEIAAIEKALANHFEIEGPVCRTAELRRSRNSVGLLHYSGHMEPVSDAMRWSLQLEDGSSTPRDVLARVGPGTELATLLSCYSGDRSDQRPEPWSIATSLLAAGARNVVCCLWEVPDEMAAAISGGMYETWVSDRTTVPAALRAGVTRARKHWSPSFWGGVVCFGPHASNSPRV
jgi:CHAT domain-containing protein